MIQYSNHSSRTFQEQGFVVVMGIYKLLLTLNVKEVHAGVLILGRAVKGLRKRLFDMTLKDY